MMCAEVASEVNFADSWVLSAALKSLARLKVNVASTK
jgi:hypothetical protein